MVVIKIDEQNGVHENVIIATVVCSIRDDIVRWHEEVLLKTNGTESISDAVFLSWYYTMNNECGNWRISTEKREMKRPERIIINHKGSNMGRLMGIPDLKIKFENWSSHVRMLDSELMRSWTLWTCMLHLRCLTGFWIRASFKDEKNDKQCIKNYRPVSLLPIFERLLFKEPYNIFNQNDLLSSNQSGFRPGNSCIN